MRKLSSIILGLVLIVSFVQKVQAQAQQKAVSLFAQAEMAYKQGDYVTAIKEYEEILQSNLESGALYFNLANSYYKKGELGKAILNYERAQRLWPRDSDVNFNYHYALAQVKDGQQEKPLSFFERFLEAEQHFYSMDEMAGIITILFILLGLGHILSLYLKWTLKLKRLMVTVLVTLLSLYGMGFVSRFQKEENAAVSLNESEAKFEPRLEATTYFKLPVGEQVKILKQEDEWVKIRRNDGKMGWVKEGMLEKI